MNYKYFDEYCNIFAQYMSIDLGHDGNYNGDVFYNIRDESGYLGFDL